MLHVLTVRSLLVNSRLADKTALAADLVPFGLPACIHPSLTPLWPSPIRTSLSPPSPLLTWEKPACRAERDEWYVYCRVSACANARACCVLSAPGDMRSREI